MLRGCEYALLLERNQPTNIVRMDGHQGKRFALDVIAGARGVDTFTLTGTYAGTYAIVAAFNDNGIQILDVSVPSDIYANGYLVDGSLH